MESLVDNFDLKNYERNHNIILRQYQITIIESAKKKNTIVYLPTGGGKTMIAIHILLSKSCEIARPFINGGKRAFFLANTKVLVYQIANTLKIHTNFKIGFYTGDMNVDSWDMIKWQDEIKSHQVLVVTAEILRQILVLKFIDPSNISVIVFDECHHANQNHPYKMIMDFLNNQSTMPLILGLSATLFKSCPKINEVEKLLQNLKYTYKATIEGGQNWSDAVKYTVAIKEKIIGFEENTSFYVENVSEIYKEAINFFDCMFIKTNHPEIPKDGKDFKTRNAAFRIKKHLVNANNLLKDLGIYCGSLAALYYSIIFEKFRIISTNKIEIQALIFAKTTFNKIRRLLAICMGEEESYNMIYQFSSQKVQKMIDLILNIQKNKNFSTLVFVHKRSTAIILSYMMKRLEALDSQFKNIKAEFVIGSSIFSKILYIPLKSNEDILKRFTSQELNTLFSTNVLEEGIDIKSCNFVISFDFPLAYSSYIQSKGRARDESSQYYVFCKSEKEITTLKLYNDILCRVKEIVGRGNILLDDYFIENSNLEEKIFISTKSGEKKIDGITAIKCVERYCNFLPQDLFAYLTPIIWYKENNHIKTAFLQLPISCPIRQTISGEGKINLKLAKKSVFLKTVQLLHENGLIDDNLCFIDHEKENVNYLFPYFKNELIDKFLAQPGTKKRRRVFYKEFADCISNCLPTPERKIYLHIIHFNPVFNEPLINQKLILYDLIKATDTYGMLSTKKLPKICGFPLFLDLGKLNCSILENYDVLTLSAKNIEDIKMFHYTLFKKVLNTVKNCHTFDNTNKENSYFIVPIQLNETQRYELNWDIICSDFCKRNSSALVPYNPNLNQANEENYQYIESYESGEGNQSISDSLIVSNTCKDKFYEQENKKKKYDFVMNEQEYLNFIVCPSYRCVSPQYYCVALCCHNMSPKSPFPREEFKDYYDYYREKYGKQITNLNQPLLKVTHVPNCSNFNNPLAGRRKNKQIKDYQEYFVPELCDILRFPSKYWIKAQFLPAVINRICHIYLVEELRKTIVRDTGLGILELPADSFWKSLVEEEDDTGKDDTKFSNINEFLNQKLPLSELKNKIEDKDNTIMELERKLFDISSCDLENYIKRFNISEEENYNFKSLETTEEINELKELVNTSVPILNLLNRHKSSRGPELAEIVRACSAVQANDMINYERLEILGDSFLKFASSLFLFKKFNEAESFLTTVKGKLISNRNLMYCSLKKNLAKFINVYDFSPLSDWNPPLFCIPEELKSKIISNKKDPVVLFRFNISEEEQFSGSITHDTLIDNLNIISEAEEVDMNMQTNSLIQTLIINDKVLADAVEALIGAYVSDSGLQGGLLILKWFGLLPEDENFFKLFKEPFNFQYLKENSEEEAMNMLEEKLVFYLEDFLGYTFKNKRLLLEALTHPSYTLNRITLSFQRLEFLGDAILDFLVTTYIYENFESFSPGKITDARSAIVNNITFGCLSIKYNFHKYMLSMSFGLDKCIEEFAKFQISRNHAIRENVLLLQEENNCLLGETISLPKALGDIFESIAGAVFLDSGNSLKTVWNIYYKLMKNVIDDFTKNIPKSSTRLLYEILHQKPNFTYFSSVVSTEDVKRWLHWRTNAKISNSVINDNLIMTEAVFEFENDEIVVRGFGKNKKDAQLSACKLGIKKILEKKK